MRIKPTHIVGSVARTLLALTFLFSGFVKVVDPLGTVYKIEDYLQFGFGHILQWAMPLAGTLAVLLITTEMLLGICMLFNVRSQWTSWITLAFYLLMTPITLYIAIDNPVSDCGCFGDALVISNWQTFYKNIILLIFAILFFVFRKSIPPLFTWPVELGIALIGLGFTAGMMIYCYTHLPIIDFRPYKVGNNIYELRYDEVAPEVEVIYTMSKNGVQQDFTYLERPDVNGDSTWTFVSQETHVVKQGKEPTIGDLYIESINYGDITDDLLLSEEPVTLIIMYHLDKRNKHQAQRAVELYKQIVADGGLCYFVTGSSNDEMIAFAAENGIDEQEAQEVFCYMDETPLKTIVRANPGVIVIQNGIVIEKHNMKQIEF